jgi:hypothetical protein
LNYSNPTRFREEVLINIGKPFDIKNYKELYRQDNSTAVNQLTADIQHRLASLIVVTDDKEEDDLVRKIELIYKRQLIQDRSGKNVDVDMTRTIVRAVNYFQDHNPKLVREIQEKLTDYFNTIKEFKVSDYLIEKSEKIRIGKLFGYILYLISGLPIYLAGLIFNYLPFIIPSKIAQWISSDEEYRAPIMMTAGIFTFPIYYTLMYWLGWSIWPSPYLMAGLTLVMPLSGFFVLQYYKRLKNFRSTYAYYRIFRRKKNIVNWFTQQRQEIINILENARQQFG